MERDKNARRQREEIISKRVLKCIPEGLGAYLDRRSDTCISIRIKKELLAEVSCPQRDGPPLLEWDNAMAKEKGLDPVDIDIKATASAPIADKKLSRAQCL